MSKGKSFKNFYFFIGIGLAISGVCGFYILTQNHGGGPASSLFVFGQLLLGFACLIGLGIAKKF